MEIICYIVFFLNGQCAWLFFLFFFNNLAEGKFSMVVNTHSAAYNKLNLL